MMPTRMSLKRNFMAACSIGVLAIVITGCSSNDKDSVSPALAAAQRQVADANRAKAAAETGQAAAETERDAALAAQTAAEEALAGAIAAVVGGFESAGIPLSPEAAAGDPVALAADLQVAANDLVAAQAALAEANTALTDARNAATADAMEIATLTQARDAAQSDLADIETALNTALADAGVTPGATMVASIAALSADLATAQAELATANVELAILWGGDTTAQEVARLFAAAQSAIEDAKAAATAAAAAVESATDGADGLTTLEVAGDSATAMANAQAVLDALGDADAAVTMANAAVASAEAALEDAETLDVDTAHRDELILALKAAVKVAEDDAKAAADSRGDDDGEIAMAVAMVEGDDEDDPMTPADYGEAVAMDIAMALLPASTTDGGGTRVTHGAVAPADRIEDDVQVNMNDHQGHTWAEIVGAPNIVDKRIAEGARTKAVKAASIAGMAGDDVNSALTDTDSDDDGTEYADGQQFANSSQDGIPGIAFCGGSDCEVDDDGDLMGSWYFTPTKGDEWYVKLTANADYTVETMYTRFGHWLTSAGINTRVNTYAMTLGNTSNLNVTTVKTAVGSTRLTDTSATYNGNAAGMSVEKTTNEDGEITDIRSGAFTATVKLKATFGRSPTIGGTVANFQGPATDPNWSVELQTTSFRGAEVDEGRTIATGRDGEWRATGYGASGARPTGIFGGFNAHFSDGHAAGAYTTRD